MTDSNKDYFESLEENLQEEKKTPQIKVVHLNRRTAQLDFAKEKVEKLMKLQKAIDPVLKHNHSSSIHKDRDYYFPEYNFASIASMFEGDSLANKAFERQEILCTKEGWSFVSENEKVLEYILFRLHEIEEATGISFDKIIETVLSDLIRFNNSFVALVRRKKASSGNLYNDGKKTLEPIAGFFPIPIETVKLKYDSNGNTVGLQQYFTYSNRTVEFNKDNFIHFCIGYKGGHSVALPSLVPASDDLIALRQQEENMLILMHQFLFPTLLYTVGTEENPCKSYEDGTTELDSAASNVANSPVDGFLIVPERHKLEAIGAKNTALDPQPSTDYFKKRFLAGASVSSLDMGEGDTANRSTSDNLSQTIIDRGKYIHKQLSDLILNKIISPLLKESTFGPEVFEKKNIVRLKFKQIDLESQIKIENHFAQMYMQHALTIDELRESIGRDEMTDEKFKRTYYKMVEETKQLLQAKTSATSAEASALAENPSSAIEQKHLTKEQKEEEKQRKENEKSKTKEMELKNRGQKAGAAQQQPSNQHGKKSGPEKRKSSLSQFVSDRKLDPLVSIWEQNKKSIASRKKTIDQKNLTGVILNIIKLELYREIESNILNSFRDNDGKESFALLTINRKIEIKKVVNDLFERLQSDILRKLDRDKDNKSALDILDSFDYRFQLIQDTERKRSLLFGKLYAFYSNGIKEVSIKRKKDSKIIKKIITNQNYKYCPPVLHPNSDEDVELISENN